jgi:organic hydroperoxide reductase OsmC/OhrA
MDIRSLQKPLKDLYRKDPQSSLITLTAKGGQTGIPVACSVDLGRAIYNAEAHTGVGGAGSAACSGDLLLGALAACAQITCQMVAAAMGIPTTRIEVKVDGKLDLRGTLGLAKDAPGWL